MTNKIVKVLVTTVALVALILGTAPSMARSVAAAAVARRWWRSLWWQRF